MRIETTNDFRRRAVTTPDGVRIPVVESGPEDAPPIVLVHGLASSKEVWSGVMRVPSLATRFRMIAFDLRGHGGEAQSLTDEQLAATTPESSERTWATDLAAVTDGLAGFHVVGWSFGCRVTAGWMHQNGGLGAANGATFLTGPNVLAPLPPDDPAAGAVRPEAIPILARAASGGERAYAEILLGHAGDPAGEGLDSEQLEAVAAVAAMTNPGAAEAALAAPFDYRPFFRELPAIERQRLHALVAADDLVFATEPTAASWVDANISATIVDGQPHAWPMTDPAALVSALLIRLGTDSEDRQPRI